MSTSTSTLQPVCAKETYADDTAIFSWHENPVEGSVGGFQFGFLSRNDLRYLTSFASCRGTLISVTRWQVSFFS